MDMVIILDYEKENVGKKRIKIFDTTLRDGEQSPGATMSSSEKVAVAKQLEKMGVDIIEAGFPASNQKDFEAIRQISKEIKSSQVCALARCTKSDIDSAWGAISEAKNPRIHVFLATSDIHLKYKLKINQEEAISRIRECVSYAKSFCKNIEFSAEDATRTEIGFLKRALEEAVRAGATTINIPDSVGYSHPKEYGEIIGSISKCKEFSSVDISVHCHDDLGMAVANSIFGIENGATQVECTVNGIGERAGNAALEEIVMAIKTRGDYYKCYSEIDITQIIPSSKMVSQYTKIFVQKNKAIVGANAFAHEAGIHQHGMIANPSCYEVVNASLVGAETKLVLGRHSGKHAIIEFMKTSGIPVNEENISKAVEVVKNTEKGIDIEEAIKSVVSVKEGF
ncbi:MAG: 2-isopropylmalate synthase [archaeon]|jgi:2-isopropylmalate synthase